MKASTFAYGTLGFIAAWGVNSLLHRNAEMAIPEKLLAAAFVVCPVGLNAWMYWNAFSPNGSHLSERGLKTYWAPFHFTLAFAGGVFLGVGFLQGSATW